jgi:hypothetical protein
MPIKEDTDTSAGRKHPVPQNVMDVEFKVVGDLTVRQIFYLAMAGTFAYLFFKSNLPLFWKWFFIITSTGLGIGVAFVPIQERGMDKWVVSFVKAVLSPSQRVWRKSYSPPAYYLADYANIIKNELITLTPAKSRNKLDEFLGQVHTTDNALDSVEIERLDTLKKFYSSPSSFTKKITPTIQPSLKPESINDRIRSSSDKPTIKEIHDNEMETKEELLRFTTSPKVSIDLSQIDRAMVNLPSKLKGEINIKTKTQMPTVILEEDIRDLHDQEKDLEKKVKEFFDLLDKAKKEFSINSAESERQVLNRQNKLHTLMAKLEQLNNEKAMITGKISENAQKAKNNQSSENGLQNEVFTLEKKNRLLENELTKIQKQLELLSLSRIGNIKEPTAKEDEAEDRRSGIARTHIAKTPTPERKSLGEHSKPISHPTIQEVTITGTNREAINQEENSSNMPNVIHGIVKDKNGVLLESAVVMIKDGKGDVVRALKTNKLGQFKTQTALENGKYTIEAIKGGEKFDIISVETRGFPIPAVTLIGKK